MNKGRLELMIADEKYDGFIVNSFDEAEKNAHKKNIVLSEDGIYITFKADFPKNQGVFGEIVSWVDDEFDEDESVYETATNAVVRYFQLSDKMLNQRIRDKRVSFTPY